jgi:hypothetical protein
MSGALASHQRPSFSRRPFSIPSRQSKILSAARKESNDTHALELDLLGGLNWNGSCELRRMRLRPLLFFLSLSGCIAGGSPFANLPNWQAILYEKVSFDRPSCPGSALRVVRVSNDCRNAEVDACGAVRRYQNIGENRTTWVDVTEGAGDLRMLRQ